MAAHRIGELIRAEVYFRRSRNLRRMIDRRLRHAVTVTARWPGSFMRRSGTNMDQLFWEILVRVIVVILTGGMATS
jgi:hypothetical protein